MCTQTTSLCTIRENGDRGRLCGMWDWFCECIAGLVRDSYNRKLARAQSESRWERYQARSYYDMRAEI